MKCKFCDGSGKDYWQLNGVPYPCPVCNGTGEIKDEPPTNDEWRRNCSTEDFAKFICNLMKGEDLYLGVISARNMIKDELNHGKNGSFVIYEWLKEKHNDN